MARWERARHPKCAHYYDHIHGDRSPLCPYPADPMLAKHYPLKPRRNTGSLVSLTREIIQTVNMELSSRLWALTEEGRLATRRGSLGGNLTDAVRWPDRWQSAACAAFLCSSMECPSDEYDLGCTHSCHGSGI